MRTDTTIPDEVVLPEAKPVVLPAAKQVVLPAFLEQSRLLNVHQFAAVLGLSVAHVRKLCRTGKLPAPVRINGGKCRWPAHVAAKLVGAPDQNAA